VPDFPDVFGSQMFMYVATVSGVLTEEDCTELSSQIVQAVEMTSIGTCTFPYPKEEIGVVHVRALLESFCVIDSWWPAHDAAYIHLASCKEFAPAQVQTVLVDKGLSVTSEQFFRMAI
jgi:hypothetical protein